MNFALNIVAKTSIILFSAGLLSLILRRASASTRHALWLLALTGAVLVPVVVMVVPQLEWPVLPEATTSVRLLAPEPFERGIAPSTTYIGETSRQVLSRWIQPAFVWAIGLGLLLVRLLLGTLAVRRIANRAATNEPQEWDDLIRELSVSLSLRRPAGVLFSDSEISPMTWGIFHHTILLPSSAAQWTQERRRLVLTHELAHVKRHDGIIQIFVQFVCSIYWFNPLAWYAAHRVRIERELACDDHVLNLGAAAEDYADHLVQIVRSLRGRHSLSFAAVSMAQPSQLETRLVSILDRRVRRRGISRLAVTCLCAMTCALTVSIAAVGVTGAIQPPPLLAMPRIEPPATEPAEPQKTRIGDAGTLSNNTIVPPQVIESKPPIYTDEAIRAGIEGAVTLEVDVDAEGKFKILRVVKGLGKGLDERAMGAVLDWKFSPALRNGVPVQAITQVDVEYKLPPPPKVNGGVSFRLGGSGVMPPTVLSRVEPEYSDEARQAHYQGTVVLEITVKKDGTPDVLRVARSLGMGLDESAVAAIKQWRFKPGTRNGVPVDVSLNVEVNFNLK